MRLLYYAPLCAAANLAVLAGVVGAVEYFTHKPTPVVAVPLPRANTEVEDLIAGRTNEIFLSIEGLVTKDPGSAHVVSALFPTTGTIEFVSLAPPHSAWDETVRDKIFASIWNAVARGAGGFHIQPVKRGGDDLLASH